MKVNSRHNLKNSKGYAGHKHSEQSKKIISLKKIGNSPWNKGKKGYHTSKLNSTVIIKICPNCKKQFQKPAWKIRRSRISFCSHNCHYKYMIKENHASFRGILRIAFCKEQDCNKELSNSFNIYCKRHAHSSERSPYWKGGIANDERAKAYRSIEYKIWRTAVFKRDNYICQNCNIQGGYLEADHIKPWILYPQLRYNIDNGQTLCKKCHSLKTGLDIKKYNRYNYVQLEIY